jgi:hypothetical protein
VLLVLSRLIFSDWGLLLENGRRALGSRSGF